MSDEKTLSRRKLLAGTATTLTGIAGCLGPEEPKNKDTNKTEVSSIGETNNQYTLQDAANEALEENDNYKVFDKFSEYEKETAVNQFEEIYDTEELINETTDQNGNLKPEYTENNQTIELDDSQSIEKSDIDWENLNETLNEGEYLLETIGELQEIYNNQYETQIAEEIATNTFNTTETQNISMDKSTDSYKATIENPEEDQNDLIYINNQAIEQEKVRWSKLLENFSKALEIDGEDYRDQWIENVRGGNLEEIISVETLGTNYEINTDLDVTGKKMLKGYLDGELSDLELTYLENQDFGNTENIVTNPLSDDWSGDNISNDAAIKMFEDPREKQLLFSENENFKAIEEGSIIYQVNTEEGVQESDISMESWEEFKDTYLDLKGEFNKEVENHLAFSDKEERNQALVNINDAFMTSLGDSNLFENKGEPINSIERITGHILESSYSLERGGILGSITERFNRENSTDNLISGLDFVSDPDNYVSTDDVEEAVEDLDSDYSDLNVEDTIDEVQHSGGGSSSNNNNNGDDGGDGGDHGGKGDSGGGDKGGDQH